MKISEKKTNELIQAIIKTAENSGRKLRKKTKSKGANDPFRKAQ